MRLGNRKPPLFEGDELPPVVSCATVLKILTQLVVQIDIDIDSEEVSVTFSFVNVAFDAFSEVPSYFFHKDVFKTTC